MSIASSNNIGNKLSTRIRQSGFDPQDVESLMYLGSRMVPMYAHALKRSTWGQIFWTPLCAKTTDKDNVKCWAISGLGTENISAMDYLLALAVEATFPQVTLKPTAAPVVFSTNFLSTTITDPSTTVVLEDSQPLYFYVSDGTLGLPQLQIYVGTWAALTNSRNAGGLSVPETHVKPYVSYAPRHRVGWGDHALLAAIKSASFRIDGVDYEDMSRHAIYNALQYRMRQGHWEVAGREGTSMDAVLLPAPVGNNNDPVILGGTEEERYKGFVLPHSFTTSAFTTRGENGKHKSAYPVLLSCRDNLSEKIDLVEDLRDILVLEEEILPSYGELPVVFVATPDELDFADDEATNNVYFTDGSSIWMLYSSGMQLFDGTNYPNGPYVSGSTYIVRFGSTDFTYTTQKPFKVADFQTLYLECTGKYMPVTRPTPYCCDNPFSKSVNYDDWIVEQKLELKYQVRCLGAIVTDLERGMMKADCRGKKWMYERYTEFDQTNICPGDEFTLEIDKAAGQTKYAFTFAINKLSELQGQFFNYTNDTDYEVIYDEDNGAPKYVFDGADSITHLKSRIQGHKDEDHQSGFYRYIDNPLFSERTPKEKGLHIFPRYANFINCIYPDGSINSHWSDATITVKTRKSGTVDIEDSEFYEKANTYCYDLKCIVVAWNVVLFQICG